MARLENELALEELLVAHPELLEPELELVGRQLPAAGGWLDLLAVDGTGRLVIYDSSAASWDETPSPNY